MFRRAVTHRMILYVRSMFTSPMKANSANAKMFGIGTARKRASKPSNVSVSGTKSTGVAFDVERVVAAETVRLNTSPVTFEVDAKVLLRAPVKFSNDSRMTRAVFIANASTSFVVSPLAVANGSGVVIRQERSQLEIHGQIERHCVVERLQSALERI